MAGKDEAKIWRCFWRSIFGRFGAIFWRFFLRSGSKNIANYSVFVFFAWKQYILQQGKNCVNTTVFAPSDAKTTVNTTNFATWGRKHCKYRGFRFLKRKKHRYLQRFFLQGCQKDAKTPPIWRFLGVDQTATIRSVATSNNNSNSNSNNSNNNNNSLPASHTRPQQHRRCAKLYNIVHLLDGFCDAHKTTSFYLLPPLLRGLRCKKTLAECCKNTEERSGIVAQRTGQHRTTVPKTAASWEKPVSDKYIGHCCKNTSQTQTWTRGFFSGRWVQKIPWKIKT